MTESPARHRPTIVTAAVFLMALAAAAYLADAIALVAGAGEYPSRVAEAAGGAGVNGPGPGFVSGMARGLSMITIAITTIAAVAIAVLAMLVARGSFAARIVTWSVIGFTVLCDFCGLGSAGAGFSGVVYVNTYSTDSSGTHSFSQRLPQGYPDWYQPLSLSLAIFAVLALIAACVFLALPPANAYFRRAPRMAMPPQPTWYATPPPQRYLTPDQAANLDLLNRKRQRGELSEAEYVAEYHRILGG
jgi:hypothetical protein